MVARLERIPLARIADSGVVGIVLWSASGRIDEANDRFLEIVGYSREDLARGALDRGVLVAPDRVAYEAAALEALHRDGIARSAEHEWVRKDGVHVFVRLHSTVLPERPGDVLSIAVDVTRQKVAERELRAAMEAEQRARAEAEGAVRARDDILAIVSHDLRNPLNIVAMSATLLEASPNGATVASQVGIIRRAVAGMNRLIRDLLDVSLVTSGKLAIEPAAVPVATLVEDARAMFEPLLAAKSQRFECAVPDEGLVVVAEAERIAQVLGNLVGNATKFTPEGGCVRLRAEADGDFVRFEVSDTGPGLGSHDLPHIFDRFWQARRVRRGGVGLGLPIAKGIVDAHGGRIWAESRAGVGTTFGFTIPRAGNAAPSARIG